jgi:hypothetical protein
MDALYLFAAAADGAIVLCSPSSVNQSADKI